MNRIEQRVLSAAARHPEAPALIWGSGVTSYRSLSSQALAVARTIRAVSEPKQTPIGVMSAKSPGTVIAFLGCLLAGMPYVPVDPGMPDNRQATILRDCGARLVLYDEDAMQHPPGWNAVRSVAVQTFIQDRDHADVPSRPPRTREDVAFILYTSGSTGKPKGVVTTHANVLPFISAVQDLTAIAASDVVACLSPLHFDMHIFDLYNSLANGAAVVLVDGRTALIPQALDAVLRESAVTVAYAVPSLWRSLLRSQVFQKEGIPTLRLLMYSGEEFAVPHLRRLHDVVPQARVLNIYGPVETNAATFLEVAPQHLALDRIPIGRPFGTCDVVLRTDDGRVTTEVGIEGEILVRGPAVFKCYLNDESLTRQSRIVVRDRTGADEYEYYRTGDYAVWGDDELLHFRGRRDDRVKTRGYRVELGDVEAALTQHSRVDFAAVVPRFTSDLACDIVGFVVTSEPIADSQLFAWCRTLLPSYMVPREIRVVPELPLTRSGKVDRASLRSQLSMG